MRTRFGIAILVALFVLAAGAWAGTVPVTDPDFTLPNCPGTGACAMGTGNGWTGSSGNTGVQNATGAGFSSDPGGTQFGLANTGGTLEEILSTNVAANTTYTLTLDVAMQPTNPTFGAIVELLAGTNVVATATAASPNGNVDPTTGGVWQLWTLTYNSAVGTSFVGQALAIELGSTVIQSDYTNVSVTSNANGSGAAPEPAMFALVGAGLLGLVARRRFAK